MTGDERRFWRDAFLAAELPTLFRKQARFLSPTGAAHIAADFADAALVEYRRRVRRSDVTR
jgi:hypothetical protein